MAKETTKAVNEEKKEKPQGEKRVTIMLPLSRNEKDDVYVGINGKGYLIKRGEPVEVPVSVAEVLRHRDDMINKALEFEESASANF